MSDNSSGRLESQDQRLLPRILRLNSVATGLAAGLLCGLMVFLATIWLVIKGGNQVGPHLQLLSQFFIGYRVTVLGSLIGFGYGFILGAVSGALVAGMYNLVASRRGRTGQRSR